MCVVEHVCKGRKHMCGLCVCVVEVLLVRISDEGHWLPRFWLESLES